MVNYNRELEQLFMITLEEGASDIHFSVGRKPTLRIDDKLIPLERKAVLTPEDTAGFAEALLTDEQRQELYSAKEFDFSYEYKDKARFRTNAFFQRGVISIAMRFISKKIRTIEELGLPPVMHEFTKPKQGFVILVGPAGHGKSTTVAALLDEINHTKPDHIITIEDPIEYVFTQDKAIIDQREVLRDTKSFSAALRACFRQDPDVIMVGEMRDTETTAIAITAAETGHLVFATLHTNNAPQTIDRIVDSFPAEQQGQIRVQLAASLFGVISERLIPRLEGGMIPAIEVMFSTPAVANLIRENKTHELNLVIETSAEEGMVSLNRALVDLVRRREISLDNALLHSSNPGELKTLLKR